MKLYEIVIFGKDGSSRSTLSVGKSEQDAISAIPYSLGDLINTVVVTPVTSIDGYRIALFKEAN